MIGFLVLFSAATGGRKLFLKEGTYEFWAGPPWPTTHPPNSPSGAPTHTKRVPICSFLNRHPSAYPSRPETEVLQIYGAINETWTPMHVTNQAPISVLHSRFSFTFQKLVSTKQAFFLASRSNARCYVSVKFSAFCSQPRFDLLYYQSSKRSHLYCA